MFFRKNQSFNHWPKNETSYLFEKRFLYFALSSARHEKTKFPTEYVQGMDILGNTIKQIDNEIAKKQKRSRLRGVLAGLSGEESLDQLVAKKETYMNVMNGLNKPITSEEEYDEALKDNESYSSALAQLRSPDLDQVALEDRRTSDIGVFFSKKLNKAVDFAQTRMIGRDKIYNFMTPKKGDKSKTEQAHADWARHDKELRDEINKEKQKEIIDENQILLLNAARSSISRTNWINQRIDELEAMEMAKKDAAENKPVEGADEDYNAAVKKQVDEDLHGKSAKIHKNTIKRELADVAKVSNLLSDEHKLELNNILMQAKFIKETQVKKYLENRFKNVLDRFDSTRNKKPPRISQKMAEEMKYFLNGFEKNVINNPDLYKAGRTALLQTSENIDKAEKDLDKIDSQLGFFDEKAKNPEAFKTNILRKVEGIKCTMREFTPDRIENILNQLDAQEKARIASLKPEEKARNKKYNKFGESVVYKNKREFFIGLKDPKGPFKNIVAEVEKQTQKIDEMDQEELADLKISLDDLHEKLLPVTGDNIDKALGLKKRTDGEIATRVINLLKNETDTERITHILEEYLGDEHFELVSDDQFTHYGVDRQNLKDYTGGNMVFYERGDKWKIIINKEVLADGESLQSQLTHELLHLEFEKNNELKAEWLKLFTKNAGWENIRRTFIASFPNKKPPAGKEWKAEDILSEIFAMQNDIFKSRDEKFNNIFKSIRDAGITAQVLGLPPELVRGFDNAKTAKEILEAKFRGSEGHDGGGHDAGGHEGEGGGEAKAEGGSGSAEKYKKSIDKNNAEIGRILSSEYVRFLPGSEELLNITKKYNEETNELNEDFKNNPGNFLNATINERINKVEEEIHYIDKQIYEVAENIPNASLSTIRSIWNRSQFMSLEDFFQVGKDIKEWWVRRHGRRRADHAARIGSAIFDKIPLPIASEFGTEASARFMKAEEAEVHEWKDRLAHRDAAEIIEILHKLADELDPNKDMFKAVIRILADKGRINWRDNMLWRLLNKLQGKVELKEFDDSLLKNPILLRQKLHSAFGEIYDYDEYLNLDRTNGSNYGSGKEKYFGAFNKIQDQLIERCEMLLRKHRNHENVDPQEFEGIIQYSIKNGKMTAEHTMFYLITGVAHGLLYADRPLALDSEFMNEWPALQWIYHHKPPLTKKDYIKISKENFNEEFNNNRMGEHFRNFFWTEINNDELVVQRVRKSVSERKWDHDWGRSIAPLGDANTAKRFLAGRSGQQEAKDTAVENAYVGALQWLEENAKNPHKINATKEYARQIAWVTMFDGIIDNVAYDRGSSDISSRGNASMLNAIPREAGVGNHAKWTTGQHRKKIRDFLTQFDPQFFKMIRDQVWQKKDKGVSLGIAVRDYLSEKYPELAEEMRSVKEIDHIFEKLDAIIQVIVNRAAEEGKLYEYISNAKV